MASSLVLGSKVTVVLSLLLCASAAGAQIAEPRSKAAVQNRARDLAVAYLTSWSAPNRQALASAASFYSPTATFHGRTRSLRSILAEKRRFAERWPNRAYRYQPATMQVACEAVRARCTVRSLFTYSASNPRQGRRSQGVGEHVIMVRLWGKPVIVSESSRVLRRRTAARIG
jgi:hypothetical protein